MGRKSKYDEVVAGRLDEIKQWRKVGVDIAKICTILGISERSYHNYVKQYPDFAEAVKAGQYEYVGDLRGELAKLATKHTLETRKQYIRQDAETGHKIQYTEITTREVDADVAAINLLLKNLDRDNWSNDPQNLELRKQELELKKKIAECNNFGFELEGKG